MAHTKADHALIVIKAGLNAIPVLGGVPASLIGDYVPRNKGGRESFSESSASSDPLRPARLSLKSPKRFTFHVSRDQRSVVRLSLKARNVSRFTRHISRNTAFTLSHQPSTLIVGGACQERRNGVRSCNQTSRVFSAVKK